MRECWTTQPVFVLQKLDELRRFQPPNLPSLISSLIQKFIAEATTRGEAIASACGSSDIETIQRHAHSLKSASAIFGLQRLSALCERIDHVATTGAQAEALALAVEVATELPLAIESLRTVTV